MNPPHEYPHSCPIGGGCDSDDECFACALYEADFWSGAGPANFVLDGLNYLTEHEDTDFQLSTRLENSLNGINAEIKNMSAERLRSVLAGLIYALRRRIPHPSVTPPTQTQPKDDPEPTLATDPAPTANPYHEPRQSSEPSPSAIGGHPHRRHDNHQYVQGGTYATHILIALAAINAGDSLSAGVNARAADRILWQHAEACADDLRDFIAGVAGLNERHLESLRTTIYY